MNNLLMLAEKAAAELTHLEHAKLLEDEDDLFDLDLGQMSVDESAKLVQPLRRLRLLEMEIERCREQLIREWADGGGSLRKLSELTGMHRRTLTKRISELNAPESTS